MTTREAATDEILNLEEASRYLRIKRRTLYTLAARGLVPAAKIGGQWRFRRSQLEGLFDDDQRVASARNGGAAQAGVAAPTGVGNGDNRK